MEKKKRIFVFTLIAVTLLVLLLSIIVSSTGSDRSTEIKSFSDGNYKISFAKCGRGPKGDGTVQEIYSVNSDGTNLRLEKSELSEEWEKEVRGYGIRESMGSFHGDFTSPDKAREFVVKTGLFNTGWFAVFTKPELYVTKKDFQQKLLWKKGFAEAMWLSDNRRVIVVSDKIYIVDSETGNYASLINEYGCMIKVEENK